MEKVRQATGKVNDAGLAYAHCYLRFRPSEFLALRHTDYDPKLKAFTGGAKTDAGKNRVVTVSPKIQKIVDAYAAKDAEQFFCAADGSTMDIKQYRQLFYDLLDALGLENPTYKVNDDDRHTYTPHFCRHTFATLMKRVDAASTDKLKLIGHTSDEMLRFRRLPQREQSFSIDFFCVSATAFYFSSKSSIVQPKTFAMRYRVSALALLMSLLRCSYI